MIGAPRDPRAASVCASTLSAERWRPTRRCSKSVASSGRHSSPSHSGAGTSQLPAAQRSSMDGRPTSVEPRLISAASNAVEDCIEASSSSWLSEPLPICTVEAPAQASTWVSVNRSSSPRRPMISVGGSQSLSESAPTTPPSPRMATRLAPFKTGPTSSPSSVLGTTTLVSATSSLGSTPPATAAAVQVEVNPSDAATGSTVHVADLRSPARMFPISLPASGISTPVPPAWASDRLTPLASRPPTLLTTAVTSTGSVGAPVESIWISLGASMVTVSLGSVRAFSSSANASPSSTVL